MKEGNWIPLDKRLTAYLPHNRPYTELEAMFSLTKDIDENNEKSFRDYSRIWSWSRQKVNDFMEKLRATNKPIESQKKADRKPPFRIINNDLQEEESRKKANERPEESHKKAGTINPNPNKNHTKKFMPPSVDEVRAYALEIGFKLDAQHFIDSNTAKGWVVGKNKTPMVDWKATIRTWYANHKKENPVFSQPQLIQGTPEYNAALQKRLAL